MITLPTSADETRRVDMVRSFGLLDQMRAPQHDEIAALARDLAGTRWAVVSLVEAERVWFSGAANYSGTSMCRWASFCTHAVANPTETTWIADTREDFRVSQHGSVTGEPRIRFYAGAPVLVNGHAVGTVCVFDPAPRAHDPLLARALMRLAAIVAEDLAARHREQAMRSALLASADALIECNDHGVITAWSDSASALFGFSPDEAIGNNVNIIVPQEIKEAHNHGLEQWRLRGGARVGRRIELRACRKDGNRVDIELWMSIAHVNGVPHIHANIRDISERTAQAAALHLARTEAEAANEAKTTFLTNMSHELRTPLNGVIGVVDLLSQTQQSIYQQELTAIIKTSSDQLRRLIGDILDLARIEAGEVVLNEAPLSLVDMIDDVTAVASLVAEEKGVVVRRVLAPDLPAHVLGDGLRLKQVLTNLVANSVKFTEAGTVTLRLDKDGDGYRFEVRDTGIGFNAAQRDAVFGRFQQADGTITRRFGGSGLGLAICTELVAAMGGVLDCHSVAGEGSTFWFTVTLADACQEVTETEAPVDDVPGLGRVLVVDDNPTNRRVAQLILQTIGAEVCCAEDGEQAVAAYASGPFDVILMDMMMPVMDGASATRAIRALEAEQDLPRTPVIMLTANSLPEHVEASLAAGADLHLPKPMNPQSLFDALGKVAVPDRSRGAAGSEAA
ncbi:MAG: ATP-binding protein [Brevundimonas sp.]|uniref:ATP-binding protein n=1 Tax=Brevundimonas sp. TaxID=1871086 RepID=UPI002ABB2D29|nr:ATP-binding protein [Brevundimonas sp.]MDZ4111542.1 ATP-binding protein [Brevundimonas sp.]